MASTIPSYTPLNSPIAEQGDRCSITTGADVEEKETEVSQKFGIPSLFSTPVAKGGKYIRRDQLNGLLNLISQFQYYLQSGGFFTFDSSTSATIGGYPEGAVLFYVNGDDSCFVRSKKNNNTDDFSQEPVSYIDEGTGEDSKSWLKVSPSINDVKDGYKRIVVVDDMPSAFTEGTFYFIRG